MIESFPALPGHAGRGSAERSVRFTFPLRSRLPILPGFLVLAFAVGGAGANYPILEGTIQLAALAIIAHAAGRRVALPRSGPTRMALLFFAAVVVLLAVQIVPLPPSLTAWRSAAWEGVASDGLGGKRWRPISATPDLTFRALLALLPALAAFLATLRLSTDRRREVLGVVVLAALASVALGALQLASGDAAGWLRPFATGHRDTATGLFVNRNHQAVFLLVAIFAVAAAMAQDGGRGGAGETRRRPRTGATVQFAAVVFVLALGVLATGSRNGLIMLPFAIAGSALMALRIGSMRVVAMALAVMALGAAMLARTPLASRVLARFEGIDGDARFEFWRTSWAGIRASFPLGYGVGSFRTVYQAFEPLADLGPAVVNHAHNDLLEAVFEAGLPGLLLAVALPILLAVAAVDRMRSARSRQGRLVALAGAGGVTMILAQSLVDYPLRMPAIAVLFGVLCAMIMPPPAPRVADGATQGAGAGARPARIAAFAVCAALALAVVSAALGQSAGLRGRYDLARLMAPWAAAPWSNAAGRAWIDGDARSAHDMALRALRIAPQNAAALRTAGLAAPALGDEEEGERRMLAAARASWRDLPTQFWVIERSVAMGRADIAIEHMDAVLRQTSRPEALLAAVPPILADRAANRAFARRLADRPPWRRAFFASLAGADDAQVAGVEQLLRALAATSAPPLAREIAPLAQTLAQRNRLDLAFRLVDTLGHGGLLGDPSFENGEGALPMTVLPMAWRIVPGSSLKAIVVPRAGADGALAAQMFGPLGGTRTALAQTVRLSPGTYRFQYRIADTDAGTDAGGAGIGGDRRVEWTLRCAGNDGVLDGSPLDLAYKDLPDGWREGVGYFTLPPNSCRYIDMRMDISGSGTAGGLAVDAVALTTVR